MKLDCREITSVSIHKMAADLLRDSPLFDKGVDMQIFNGPEELRNSSLTFRIIHGTRTTTSPGQTERVVHFEIADEDDPFFLYALDVGEQDFHFLKREQALLVDFPVFPFKLIELVDLCQATSAGQGNVDGGIQQSQGSTFVAKLDTLSSVLSIVEANMFKQLTHISLQLRPGNDAMIKMYLASRLSVSMGLSKRLEKELNVTSQSLHHERSTREALENEVTQLRSERETTVLSMESKHEHELASVRAQAAETLNSMRLRHEESEAENRALVDRMREENHVALSAVELQLSELSKQHLTLEYQHSAATQKLSLAESERDKSQQAMSRVQAEHRQSEEARSKVEIELARATAKNDSLMQQIRDKDDVIKKSEALLAAEAAAHKSLDEKVNTLKKNGETLQSRLKASAAEIVKGNEIIAGLQQAEKDLRDKVRAKGEVIRRQEALVGDLRERIGQLEAQALGLNESLRTTQNECTSLKQQIAEANSRVSEGAKIIANNQEVIAYLNEEINKWQLGMRVSGDINLLYGSSVAAGNAASGTSNAKNSPPEDDPYRKSSVLHRVTPLPSSSLTRHGHVGSSNNGGVGVDSYSAITHTGDAYYSSAVGPVESLERTAAPAYASSFSQSGANGVSALSSEDDRSLFRKGMQNLGLGDSFGDIQDVDLGLGLESNTVPGNGGGGSGSGRYTYSTIVPSSSRGTMASTSGVTTGRSKAKGTYSDVFSDIDRNAADVSTNRHRPSARLGFNASGDTEQVSAELDLESTDYYSTNVSPAPAGVGDKARARVTPTSLSRSVFSAK